MSSEKPSLREVKIILLGDSGVGKTSIINRYINNRFNPEMISSLGSKSNEKIVMRDNIKYKLIIWDTSGQEVYRSLTNLFIKGSNIVILVYSIDSLSSFEGLDYWYKSLLEKIEGDNYILAVVGSKVDLINEEVISEEQGKKYAEEKKAFFKLVSSKEDPKGIEQLFEKLLDDLIQNHPEYDQSKSYYYIAPKKVDKNNKDKKRDNVKHCC